MPKQKPKNKVISAAGAARLKKALSELLDEQKKFDAKVKKIDAVIWGLSIKHS